MAHLFNQMYVDEVDFDSLTIEKLIELVFTEMVFRKIEQLEQEKIVKHDQIDGNPWKGFRKCFEIPDDEKRWMTYAEKALSMLDHDVMWQGIVEACSGGSSVSQNKLPQLILGYIYILKYLQSNLIG